MPNASTVAPIDNQNEIVQDIYRLTAERLKARLENPAELTGAELQAALRFCADYKAAADSAQRAAESSLGRGLDRSDLPFLQDGKPNPSHKGRPSAVDRERLQASLASAPFSRQSEEQP